MKSLFLHWILFKLLSKVVSYSVWAGTRARSPRNSADLGEEDGGPRSLDAPAPSPTSVSPATRLSPLRAFPTRM